MAMSGAERTRRYRARRAGEDVPYATTPRGPKPGHGGRPRNPDKPVWDLEEAIVALENALDSEQTMSPLLVTFAVERTDALQQKALDWLGSHPLASQNLSEEVSSQEEI